MNRSMHRREVQKEKRKMRKEYRKIGKIEADDGIKGEFTERFLVPFYGGYSYEQAGIIYSYLPFFTDDELYHMQHLAFGGDYSKYLSSQYWRVTSAYLKGTKNHRCEICGGEGEAVHHKTYKHCGSELRHPEDVQVLCRMCHAKIHMKGRV